MVVATVCTRQGDMAVLLSGCHLPHPMHTVGMSRCVAGNIQDAWIAFYRNETLGKSPGLPENDVNQKVMALLLNFGAKVSPMLSDNEVLIHHGFVSETA